MRIVKVLALGSTTIHEKADRPCRTTHPRLKTRLPRNSLLRRHAKATKISVGISLASETLIVLMISSLYVLCNGNVGPLLMSWFLASKIHTLIMKPAFGCGSFVSIDVKSWTRLVWHFFIVNKKKKHEKPSNNALFFMPLCNSYLYKAQTCNRV